MLLVWKSQKNSSIVTEYPMPMGNVLEYCRTLLSTAALKSF